MSTGSDKGARAQAGGGEIELPQSKPGWLQSRARLRRSSMHTQPLAGHLLLSWSVK